MGARIISDVNTRLRQVIDRTTARSRRGLRAGAQLVADRAREYAPVDTENLENAIGVAEGINSDDRRLIIDVGVDLSRDSRGQLSRYAIRMHEGEYSLGPKSAAKDAGRGVVGRGYLERAADETEEQVKELVQKGIREALK